ncbi:MAG TPA: acylphosphatase [Sphingomicrobium sp.]
MIARHIRVVGQVQGVFFRAWTVEQAGKLGVTGWVCNAADGSVEAHLEGEKWSVQQLVDRLRQGPPSARVEHLTDDEAEPQGCDTFEVRH